MSRPLRIAGFLALFLALALGGAASAAVTQVRQSFPQRSGSVMLPSLAAPVEVVRDRDGVPHIYADNPSDLFRAQGYVHAQERFWEMDVRRHITAGRLAELFGPDQAETDAYVRTMGWRRVAEAEVGMLSQQTRSYLDSYAAGVNGHLNQRDTQALSLEYSVLGLTGDVPRPEPWTAVDSLAWLKAMAWQLSGNRQQEAEMAVLTARLGEERARQLYPDYNLDQRLPIVTSGRLRGEQFTSGVGERRARPAGLGEPSARHALTASAGADPALARVLGEAPGGIVGSNSWAVSGEHTASGQALLSNDPHLATSMPSIFMPVGLHCRTVSASCPFDVAGFSFSGVPGVVIGHNADIAWGFTTPYLDTQDLFLEQVRGDRVRVPRGDGRPEWQPLRSRTEQIRVRGEDEPRTITVRSSRHGPLLSDVDPQLRGVTEGQPPGQGEGYAVALSWTALIPAPSIEALFSLSVAKDFDDFRAAAAQLRAPSQNLLYADIRGNIGYQLPGDIPQREGRDGTTPARGWETADDWRGMIPFSALPYTYNPPDGVIVAANQTIIGPGYPRHLGSDPSYGWRSQQLRDRLQGVQGLTLDAAEQLFYDNTVPYADAIRPTLLRAQALEPWVVDGQHALVEWDGRADADSAGAAFFYVAVANVLHRAFDDELPPEMAASSGDRWFAVLADLLQRPDDRWWDDVSTAEREDRDDIVAQALLDARREITARMARDPEQWAWGKLHTTELRHQTLGASGIGAVEAMFNRGDFRSGGGTAVVNAMSPSGRRGEYRVTNGPAMRMLVDLGDLDASRWINQSGVSGHAFEPYYDDQMELWATDRMLAFAFTEARVREGSNRTLLLDPVG